MSLRVDFVPIALILLAAGCSGGTGSNGWGTTSSHDAGSSAHGDDGGTSPGPGDDAGGTQDSGHGGNNADCSTLAYPSGPYGGSKGQVFPNLQLQGYPTYQQMGQLLPFCMAMYYDPDGSKGSKLAFIDFSSLWCGPCGQESAELPKAWQDLSPKIEFVVSLIDGPSNGTPAQQADLDTWDSKYHLPFWNVIDPGKTAEPYRGHSLPWGVVINTRDMTVFDIVPGATDIETWLSQDLAKL
jgi:hypothetical protein